MSVPPALDGDLHIRRVGIALFVLSLIALPLVIVLYSFATVYSSMYILHAFAVILSLLAGALGIFRRIPSLVWSAMLSSIATLVYMILGGISFLFLEHVEVEVDSLIKIQYINRPSEHIVESDASTQGVYLILNGVLAGILTIASALVSKHIFAVLGVKRSAAVMLQTFSLCILPFSLVLILGGQYIVETGTLASSPSTGAFLFVCGIFTLLMMLLAFVGSAFEYRRLLVALKWQTFAFGLLLVCTSVVAFILEEKAAIHLGESWNSLRILLPPTLQAKYDRTQFVSFVEANLQSMAYVVLITGLYMLVVSHAATILELIVTREKRQRREDQEFMKRMQEQGSIAKNETYEDISSHPQFAMRMKWRDRFEKSTKTQRRALRCACACCAFLLLLIIALMILSVLFMTKCGSLSKVSHDTSYDILKEGINGGFSLYTFQTKYTRGALIVNQGNTTRGSIHVHDFAIQEKYAESVVESKIRNNQFFFSVMPMSSPKIFWIDFSCQEAITEAQLPMFTANSVARSLDLSAASSIRVDLRNKDGNAGIVESMKAQTVHGNIQAYALYVGTKGIDLSTESGEIHAAEIVVDASDSQELETRAQFRSSLGTVLLQNVSIIDAVLDVHTEASQTILNRVYATATHGPSIISAKSTSGGIYGYDIRSDYLNVQTSDGKIEIDHIQSWGNDHSLGHISASTLSGEILLSNVTAQGYIHVESHSGDITLHLKSYAYKGTYYMRSEYGKVTIRKGAYSYDSFQSDQSNGDVREKTGRVNCGREDTNCYFVGDIHITSTLGNIEIVVGCEYEACG